MVNVGDTAITPRLWQQTLGITRANPGSYPYPTPAVPSPSMGCASAGSSGFGRHTADLAGAWGFDGYPYSCNVVILPVGDTVLPPASCRGCRGYTTLVHATSAGRHAGAGGQDAGGDDDQVREPLGVLWSFISARRESGNERGIVQAGQKRDEESE